MKPRYVNDNCTACGKCGEVCETEIPNTVNYDMDKVKAAYLASCDGISVQVHDCPRNHRTPMKRQKCAEACAYNAVDLTMQPDKLTYKVGAVVWATGWDPYDAANVDYLGLGRIPNVVTSVMFERLASPTDPPAAKS